MKEYVVKKILVILVVLSAWIIFTACDNPNSNSSEENEGGEENTCAVSFAANYEGADPPVYNTIEIERGGKIIRPDNPVRAGYIFLDWFAEVNGYIPYDFNTEISADTTLYARWNKPITVDSQEVSLDNMYDAIFGLENIEIRFPEQSAYSEKSGRYYRSSNGSIVDLIYVYNTDNIMVDRHIRYKLNVSNPVTITVNEQNYTASKYVSFSLPLNYIHYNLSTESGGWILKIVDGNATQFFPQFENITFTLLNLEEGYDEDFYNDGWAVIDNVYRTELHNAFDEQNMRQFEIVNYSPDVITLSGFCAGTYYYVGHSF
jgi:uncharacterized lipoprotein YehR (DUF1307 family)